jgi:hypothetical protein
MLAKIVSHASGHPLHVSRLGVEVVSSFERMNKISQGIEIPRFCIDLVLGWERVHRVSVEDCAVE